MPQLQQAVPGPSQRVAIEALRHTAGLPRVWGCGSNEEVDAAECALVEGGGLMTERMQHYLECPDCNVRMWLRDSKFGGFYGCGNYPKCDMVHSCHADGTPMGVPANKETRQARILAHNEFDKIWRDSHMSRSQAYTWMGLAMGLRADDAHIGRFTAEQCEALVGCCQDRARAQTTKVD